jgi:hypothetical protein
MAKIELRGIVKEVTEIENVGKDGTTRKQSLILFVPGFVNDFQEKIGDDEEWKLDLFNKRIDTLALNNNLIDKKVVCTVYVNSDFVKMDDGREFYRVNSNLGDIKLFESPHNTPAPATQKAW